MKAAHYYLIVLRAYLQDLKQNLQWFKQDSALPDIAIYLASSSTSFLLKVVVVGP